MLNEMEQQYPGTKHGIVNSFLEMLPLLKKKFKQRSFAASVNREDITQGIEEGKSNGELKKFLASKTKGTSAGKLLDKYVLKAETTVEAKKMMGALTSATVTESRGPGVSTPPVG